MPIVDAQIEVRQGIELQDCFVAGCRFYEELRDKVLTLEELMKYPLILFSRNSRARMAITELFQDFGFELKPEIEVGSVGLLIEMARRGWGFLTWRGNSCPKSWRRAPCSKLGWTSNCRRPRSAS